MITDKTRAEAFVMESLDNLPTNINPGDTLEAIRIALNIGDLAKVIVLTALLEQGGSTDLDCLYESGNYDAFIEQFKEQFTIAFTAGARLDLLVRLLTDWHDAETVPELCSFLSSYK